MTGEPEHEKVLPLWAEILDVAKHRKPAGRVSVSTVTRSREELVDELLTQEHADIERVDIRRLVDAAPDVRYEDDTVIIPVIEEVVVVERRLFLKEEIRIRRVRTTERHSETVMLREQEVVIRRTPADSEVHGGVAPNHVDTPITE
jgi:stress response protein YsnF